MSDIDKPAITTSVGPLKLHFDAATRSEQTAGSGGDALTTQTKHKIEHVYERANDLVRESKEHFAKYRDRWINRQYGELMKTAGPLRDLAPSWAMRDRSVQLHRAATVMVDHRHHKRMRKIQRAMINEVKNVAAQSIGKARRKEKDRDVGR